MLGLRQPRMMRNISALRWLATHSRTGPSGRRVLMPAYRQMSSAAPEGSSAKIRVERVTDFEHILDKSDSYSQIPSRAIIEVSGKDASEFLQGLQCNHMPLIDQGGAGMLTGFLAPQGRVIADGFVYPRNAGVNFPHPVFLVEVDARMKERLLKIMRFYKLRARISLRDASEEYAVWGVWGPGSGALGESTAAADVWLADGRAPGMGLRLILPRDAKPALPHKFEQKPSEIYALRRILKGVPEGPEDFAPDASVPLECNLDYMGGVHFSKGCYVGQELTIRTHHRGVVRKRVVPVLLSSAESNPTGANPLCIDLGFAQQQLAGLKPQPQADVTRVEMGGSEQHAEAEESHQQSAKPARSRRLPPGKLGGSMFNAGLALMRLEHVEAYMAQEAAGVSDARRLAFETTAANGGRLFVSPWSPSWWP
ncbi:Aminomethyltransferase folate-binding domain-containing protein, partial [Martensiomyces pterosporus]